MSEATWIPSGDMLVSEINELLHMNINKAWFAEEWRNAETGKSAEIHPFVRVAMTAHHQMQRFADSKTSGITSEIWELGELAIKANFLKRSRIKGIDKRLARLCSSDFNAYHSTRYELQIAAMLAQRGHEVILIDEGDTKTPDILVSNGSEYCEIECKHKEQQRDQIDYVRSIYNNTQQARKQFSKTCPGLVLIEIDVNKFDLFLIETRRLREESERAMRNSSSISGIFLTSKIAYEDAEAYNYRHRIAGFLSGTSRNPVQPWFLDNFINVD